MADPEFVVEMLGIRKEFPGIVANDDITLCLRKGEVHALLGENGAGKSTLMSILFGLYQPDAGKIRIRGKDVRIDNPNIANDLGIGMVHQHFKLVHNFTVTENIVLKSGAERISILDVCREAGISRGTFYRYFASQDELLDAFARHKREQFHVTLAEAVQPFQDPDERFDALIRYLDYYLEHGRARRLLVVAPEYALGFFRRIFHDSVVRFQDVLGSVFDAWEARFGVKVDRELVCELLIRYVLSEQLVPGDADRKTLPRRIGRMVEALATGAPLRARR